MDASIVSTFLTLSAVVSLFGLVLFFLKRYLKNNPRSGRGGFLQVLGRASLQPKTHIFLVRAGSRTLLVGVSDGSISTLADLTDDYGGGSQTNEIVEMMIKSSNSDCSLYDLLSIDNNVSSKNNSTPGKSIKNDTASIGDTSFSAFLRSAFRKGMN